MLEFQAALAVGPRLKQEPALQAAFARLRKERRQVYLGTEQRMSCSVAGWLIRMGPSVLQAGREQSKGSFALISFFKNIKSVWNASEVI